MSYCLDFYSEVYEAVDSAKEYNLYLDISKAFNRVLQERLIRKVDARGIARLCGQMDQRMGDRQKNGYASMKKKIRALDTSGVPQARNSAHCLFIIDLNDLDTDIISKPSKLILSMILKQLA